ncbi:MAG: hypothetical protein R3C42_00730 [Parvularculaceae bacterium]
MLVAVAIWSVGDDLDPQMLRLADDERARRSEERVRGREQIVQGFSRASTPDAMDAMEREEGAGAARIRAAVWPLTHDGGFEYITPMQRPTVLCADVAVRASRQIRVSMGGEIEAAWADIRNEFERATAEKVADDALCAEQMQRAMNGENCAVQEDWSAIHLFKETTRTPLADRFPDGGCVIKCRSRKDRRRSAELFLQIKAGVSTALQEAPESSRMTVHLAVGVENAPYGSARRPIH